MLSTVRVHALERIVQKYTARKLKNEGWKKDRLYFLSLVKNIVKEYDLGNEFVPYFELDCLSLYKGAGLCGTVFNIKLRDYEPARACDNLLAVLEKIADNKQLAKGE
jgi:hypothetical protein